MAKKGLSAFIIILMMCGMFVTHAQAQVQLVGDPEVTETGSATASVSVGFAAMMSPKEKGFCWSEQQDPKPTLETAAGSTNKVSSAGTTFTATITGLKPSTTYYVVAYAISSDESYTSYSRKIATLTTTIGGPEFTFEPDNGDTDVAQNTDITITFDAPVRLLDNSEMTDTNIDELITFKENSPTGADVSFDATVNSGKTEITINPGASLKGAQLYYVAIGSDLEGYQDNPIAAESITFSTANEGMHTITATSEGGGSITPSGGADVEDGTDKTFTMTPDDGYAVQDVEIDGESVGPKNSHTFENVTADHTIHVIFAEGITQYTISATSEGNGTLDPSGEILVNEGEDQTFTMTPGTGYVVKSMLIDDVSVSPDTSYTFTEVNAHHKIHVVFGSDQPGMEYTITSSAGTNGTIYPSGNVSVTEGVDWTFQMKPATGYVVEDVTVDDVSVLEEIKNNFYTFENVSGDHTINVTFKETDTEKYYTITATSGPNGSIEPLGDIVAKEGETKEFTMFMAVGYVVDQVLVDGVSVGGINRYIFNSVTADHTIHATFRRSGRKYTITATSGANGTVSPPGSIVVNEGDSQTFTITPEDGYILKNIMVDDVSMGGGAVKSYTFPSVITNHEIHITFMGGPTTCVPGDANGNEIIDLGDVIYNLRILSGLGSQ
ncbi:Ig-like domain-containing protein [Desulfococcaceae bacterium HSG8]|nr:Ig-like domain-containing protein [Desulfococcaceae bacterium HSG8]